MNSRTRREFLRDGGLAAGGVALAAAGCSKAANVVLPKITRQTVVDFFVSFAGGLVGDMINDDIQRFLDTDRPESRIGRSVAKKLQEGGFTDLSTGGVHRINRTFCFGALDANQYEGCVAFMSVLGDGDIAVAMIEGPAVVTLAKLVADAEGRTTEAGKRLAAHEADLPSLLVPVHRVMQEGVMESFEVDGWTKFDAPTAHVQVDHRNVGDDMHSRVIVTPTVGDPRPVSASYVIPRTSIGAA